MNGFLISVYETGSRKSFYVFYINDESILSKDGTPISIMTISGSLHDIFSKYGIADYSVKNDGIEISCSLSYKNFYNLMSETSKKLSEIPSLLKSVCSDCLKNIENSEKKFRISTDEKNKLLCEECAKKASEVANEYYTKDDSDIPENFEKTEFSENNEAFEETEENSEANEKLAEETFVNSDKNSEENNISETQKSNSVSKGIIGSFLFALSTSICFVLLFAFVIPIPDAESTLKAGYYVCWLSALIAAASVFGYKVFSKSEIKAKELLISGGISFVLTFIAQYFSSIIFFAREYVFTFENLTAERFSKMIPSLLKIPFTDKFVSPDFKIYILIDSIFIITALLIISFFIKPKVEKYVIIEEL